MSRFNMVSDCLKPLVEEYPELFENVVCGAFIEPGWVPLVREACEGMKGKNARFVQIKEKFAGLRIYVDPINEGERVPDEVYTLLYALEDKSFKICEVCGEPGKPQGKYWVTTVCEKHVRNDER